MKGHRWFAAFYDRLCKMEERSPVVRRIREDIVGGASGHVLEVGAGTGASFPYYTEAVTRVDAIEPDPFMLKRARNAVGSASRPIELQEAPAEALPFEDATFDTAVCALVLCSVSDPAKAISEIKRVLRPGGELRLYEHVRYANSLGAFAQDLIAPVWRWTGAGCNPNRDTAASIRKAGFEFDRLTVEATVPPVPPMIFVRPHLIGVAKNV